jgi:hypothetical protein
MKTSPGLVRRGRTTRFDDPDKQAHGCELIDAHSIVRF